MRGKLLFTFLIITNIIWANTDVAAPANDNFANAIPLTCGNNYTASTVEATLDENNAPDATTPQVVDLDAPNIWYSYTGSGTPETITLDLCASGYDTSYLVYTGTSGNLTLVAANDFNTPVCGAGFRSYGTFESDGNTTYYITVTGYNSSDVGPVDMTVSCLPQDAVFITDANFEQALIDLGIDSGTVNGFVSAADVNQVNDLNISNKNITSLSGIEAFTALEILICNDNAIRSINLTNQSNLTSLNCSNNDLTFLSVKNGNNTNITSFNALNNFDLACIEVDNTAYSTTNWTNIDSGVNFTQDDCTNVTFVPDDNFEQYLIDQGLDNVLDNYVLTNNINTIEVLIIENRQIDDLTGIGGFTALRTLECSGNNLTNLDLSQNLDLRLLECFNNDLVSINLSQNSALEDLKCFTNDLSTLDLTQNTALTYLRAELNPLGTLDLSQNVLLDYINLSRTQLTAIDLTANVALENVVLTNNLLTSIDVSQNVNLRGLFVEDNSLTSINLVANQALQQFYCDNNAIEYLDLSNNTQLVSLKAANNALTGIDLKSGNNTILPGAIGAFFDVTGNPNLTCIEVDDVAYSTTNWTSIDAGTNFSTDCSVLPIPANDECADTVIIPISYTSCNNTVAGTLAGATDSGLFQCFGGPDFSDVWFSFVATETAHDIKILNTSGANSSVFHTVIDAQTYSCSNITDAVHCTDALERQATGLTIGNTYFVQVFTDVANSTETFDICVASSVPAPLTYVPDDNFEQYLIDQGYDDVLDDYVLTNNINTVEGVGVGVKGIADLTGIEDFTALRGLVCNGNQLTTLDLTQNLALEALNINSNSISTLNLSQNIALRELYAVDCPILNLDVSTNLALEHSNISGTLISSFDVSGNPVFGKLYIDGASELTDLNVQNGNNTNFLYFFALNAPNLTCIQVDDVAYSNTNWTNIDAGTNFSTNCNPVPIPSNDECADTVNIPISDASCNNTVAGTLAGATDAGLFQCFGDTDFSDVWFSFVATETTHDIRILNTSGANARVFHTVIDAQTYSCSNITDAVYCTDSNEGQATGLIVGNTYFIQVFTDVANSTETFDICVSTNTIPGLTYVPDDNFEQALIDLGYDIYLDDYVTTTNINTLEILSIDSRNIGNLTGIEDFTALEQLYVGNNPLGNLNLTQNTALVLLNANNTSLSTIDLTQNTTLQYLSIESNQLTTIDITQNTALITASFQSNQLATIDVSQNTVLETLNLVLNAQFFEVDVSANSSLRTLNMNFTQVQSIDVSNNPNLESLLCANCPLEAIDVSANPTLKILSVGGTQVPFVDLSNNPVFENLFANNCFQLTGINIQNGNNTNVTGFYASNVPNLTCVQVDDVAYSTTNWTNVGAGTNFSIDCGFLENDECVNAINVPISDATCNNVIAATIVGATNSNSLQCFGNNANFADMWFSFVATETTHKIALQNLAGAPSFLWHALIDAQTYNCGNITDAIYCTDGLENTATGLTIGNTYYIQVYSHVANASTTFDICVSTNTIPGLTYVPDNNFEQALIDLSLDDVLDDYVVTSNINTVNDLNIRDLSIFDLTGIEDFAALEILNCGLNFLGELDLSQNTNLNYLIADNAALVGLNMKNGNNTNVTTFITLGNVDLFCIQVDAAAYSTANWTLIESQTNFSEYCGNPIQVAAKVYLQGAMLQNSDGSMRTDLKDNNHLPMSSPYTDGIAMSNEVFNATQINRIVDWVWVELRDATDPTIIIDGKSAILQSGGDIVDATANDIATPVSFSQAPGDYYVVIKHRNHLGIMSSNVLSLSDVVTTVDFTNSNNQITYGTNAQTTFGMPANTVGMWCGNVNGDAVVQYAGTTPDTPALLSTILNDVGNFLNFPTYVLNGYNTNDINMDGTTQYAGTTPDTPFILQNTLAHPGNFLNFSTYQIMEQLPENE